MKYLSICIMSLVLFFSTYAHAQDTIKVRTGWNMIGAISTNTLTHIQSEPTGIITSSFFGFTPTGYLAMDTLIKGYGYWVKVSQAGFIITTNAPPDNPSNPIPNDNATSVLTALTMSWSDTDPNNDPLKYDVYFGTDNPPVTKVSTGQNGTTISQSGLNFSTLYYWKIVSKDNHGDSSTSPIWRFTTTSWTCGAPISYSGESYNTVLIGSQCWLKENLDVGTIITGSTNPTNNGTIEKYCYNDDAANCNTYGALYQWDEAMNYSTTEGTQGICPSGWHIPTDAEFHSLITFADSDANALKAIGQGGGTNTTGFSALLSGYRASNGGFGEMGSGSLMWSSTQDKTAEDNLYLFNSGIIYPHSTYPDGGFSIRCLKN